MTTTPAPYTSRPLPPRSIAIAGVLTTILGLVVLFGWHADVMALTRITAHLRPMVYNTALCFVACGMGLGLLALGWIRIPRVLGSVAFLIGSARLIEIACGRNLGLDTFFFQQPADPLGLTFMALPTSVNFLIVGITIWLASSADFRRHEMVFGVLGSVVFGIGAVTVFGNLAGYSAYISGHMTGMAMHTAAGFIVLGLALYRLAWPAGSKGARAPAWTPIVVGLAGIVVTVSFWQALAGRETQVAGELGRHRAAELANKLEDQMQERLRVIDRMRGRWEIDRPSKEQWESGARLNVRDFPGFQAFAWVDPTFHARWVSPYGGNEMVAGIDLGSQPEGMAAIAEARDSGELVVTRVVELPQGGKGFLLVAPLLPAEGFDGFLIGMVRVESFFSAVWREEIAAGSAISVFDGEREVFRRHPLRGRSSGSGPVNATAIAMGGAEWSVRVGEGTRGGSGRNRLPEVSLVAGILLSLLLAAALHFGLSSRRRAEEAEIARSSLKSVLDAATQVAIIECDTDGLVTLFNRGAERMLGYSAEEMLGRSPLGLIPASEVEAVARQMTEEGRSVEGFEVFVDRARQGEATGREWTYLRKDGSRLTALITVTPVHDREGRLSGFLGISDDLTERKAAGELLSERARLAAFAADVGAALTTANEIGGALQGCADAMVRHLGGSTASVWTTEAGEILELRGSAWAGPHPNPLEPQARVRFGDFRIGAVARDRRPVLADITSDASLPEDKDWASRAGMRTFAGYPMIVGEQLVGVIAMFSSSSLTRATLDAMASVADEIGLGIDRACATDALRAEEARTRSILDNMLNGLITIDGRGRIATINPAAERMFGFLAEELLGRSLAMLLPISDPATAEAFLRNANREALGRVTEWEARRKNGEIFPMELALFQFETPDGPRMAGSVRDISERREVDRLKREFVSTVSHELRTPLTSIRGSLGLLAGGALGELPGDALEMIGVAERNVVRLVTLINDILDLERLDTGVLEMHIAPVSVSSLFSRSVEAVRAFADQQGIPIDCRSRDEIVLGDGDRLVQVLVNLLSNALKFSPRGSRVTVTAEAVGDETVEFRVTDEGRGIPPDFREKIFERFRQVEGGDSREKGGTGLGLAICAAIVGQQGGSIGVDSEGGRGSSFWVRIPKAAAVPAAGPGIAPVLSSSDVLIVEDDPLLLAVLERQIRTLGRKVRSSRNGRQAMALARQARPGLLVLDVGLPDADGFEVVAELRRDPNLRDLPLLVYTERDLTAGQLKLLTLGPTRVLTKSRSTDAEFVALVRSFFEPSAVVAEVA